MSTNNPVVAIVLPQFHPIPENDAWWGAGFTEWRNVVRAKPAFPGHRQPRLPADLGFYDLRLPETRAAQASLAKAHGINAFCYYHYWFHGRRLLERPVDDMLRLGEPDMPFCLSWANEHWSRAWNGGDREMLMAQDYSAADDEAHIHHLLPFFADRRYLHVNGKPLFVIYRVEQLPDPQRTFDTWRNIALKAGIGELCLARFESFEQGNAESFAATGIDLSIEFAPDWRRLGNRRRYTLLERLSHRLGHGHRGYYTHRVSEYADLAQAVMSRDTPPYPFVRCVTPGFDNSPRRANDATILMGSTPQAYSNWLEAAARWTDQHQPPERHLLFINAWNEWAEGNYLEPDEQFGCQYLEATHAALRAAGWR